MPLDISRIKAICFDVDGTLRDTDDQYTLRFERLFRPLKFLLPGGDAHRFARRFVMWAEGPGNALLSIPDRLHIDDELARLGDWLHHRGIGGQNHDYLLIDGTHRMLERLRPHFKMSVVSARSRRGTLGFLDHFELTQFFDVVVSAQTARRTKPWPDPIYWAAEKMSVRAEDCLMVGDTTVDLRAGKAAGTQTVGVLCGFGDRDELEALSPDLLLPTTPELADLLSSQ